MPKSHLARICWSAAALLAAAVAFPAWADTYPSRPIKIVVPWSAGGPADVVARLVGQELAKSLDQNVIIENRPGAGGNVGTSSMVRSDPDGYTLLLATSSTNAINPSLFKTLPFRPVDDLAPIALMTSNSNILEVNPSSSFNSLKDLVEAAKREPGKFNYGSGGPGSSQHIAGSMFTHQLGLDIVHVPYNGGGPAGLALLAGEITLVLDTGTLPYVKQGKLRALAVASRKRLPMLPDVPTFVELGYPDMVTGAWYALCAPAGTPEKIVNLLNEKVMAVLANPELVAKLGEVGAVIFEPMSPTAVREFMRAEVERYRPIVAQTGLQPK